MNIQASIVALVNLSRKVRSPRTQETLVVTRNQRLLQQINAHLLVFGKIIGGMERTEWQVYAKRDLRPMMEGIRGQFGKGQQLERLMEICRVLSRGLIPFLIDVSRADREWGTPTLVALKRDINERLRRLDDAQAAAG